MQHIFIRTYHYFEKNRRSFWIIFISSFALIAYFATRVRFEEDISKVLPKDKQVEKLNRVFQNSKFLDRLVFMVSQKDTQALPQPDSLTAFAEQFVSRLQQKAGAYIRKINDKVDDSLTMDLLGTITEHLPVYLDSEDYQSIDTLITREKIKESLEKDFHLLSSPAGLALKNLIAHDPVGISFLGLKKMQQLQYDDNYTLYNSYILTKDYKHLLFFITPAYPPNNTGKNEKLLKQIDETRDSLYQTGFKNLEANYFGATAVSVGNALQLRKDALYTQGITVIFLLVFIGLYFRKKRAPFIILLPVLYGALFALAAIYFLKGSISVIALGTGSVVLGVAVNYSLHVFNHYKHTKSIPQVIRDLTMPLTVGSFTTIGGFLCLEFVESDMLKDLGLFAAFSLIGASLCSLIFLPHLMASKKEQKQHTAENRESWIDKISAYHPEYNKFIVLIIILLTAVFFYTAQSVGFESDLTKMNYLPEKLKTAETKLNRINAFSFQSVYLVSEGKTLDEALIHNEKLIVAVERLKEKGIVKKYSGVSSLIISDSLQKIKIAKWNAYWTAEKKQKLIADLALEGAALKFKPAAFDSFKTLLYKKFGLLDPVALAAARKIFLDDYITEKPGQSTVVTLVKVEPQNKKSVYKAFEKDPDTTVLDRQYLTAKFVDIINTDFNSIAWMSSILVFVVLLLNYGRIELTLISFVPMIITFVWILGIMGIFGIQFNIINIIISAFIFGLGDDYSLFIMDGLMQEYKTGKKNLSSYKSSIFLSAITTIAGLGVLVFAKHPALKSIAIISMVGIFCVVIMSQILIPFLFNILIKNRVQRKTFPWTFSGFFKSAFAFTYFAVSCLILTLLGLVFVKLNFINKEKGKFIYHLCVSKFSWSLMYVMGNVKKKIINPQGENFSDPAIIICNHQSFLDILSTVMLYPKLILFTNHWVWNSPVFGFVVRMADYYPVMHGADGSVDQIANRVRQGYSVVVFPEGTRSTNGNIKRFHKGAFYLAEKLKLDILPILIHGSGYTMTKQDFLLKNGRITLKILPRIKPSDPDYGNCYAERAKWIGRYFREQYKQLALQMEQPVYFKEQLKYNYLYKGPVLEWYMRIKVRLEKNYQLFHEMLPRKGKFLDAGCGYGFMSYMLQFASPDREITGIDYDEEKIETANHCLSKNDKTNFYCSDVLQFPFEKYDGIILSDILHYLQPLQQRETIEKCIRHLNRNGILLIRDGNKDLGTRHAATRFTEFISTTFSGFNKTSAEGLSFFSGNFIREIAERHNIECTEIAQAKYTSNIIFVIKNNQVFKHATI
jgi:uncharacterized protein